MTPFDRNRMLAGYLASNRAPENGYFLQNPAKKKEPSFTDALLSDAKKQGAAAAQGAKKAAATAVSNTAQSAIDSAAGLAASKINSVLGVSSGSGKLSGKVFKKTIRPEWQVAVIRASTGTDSPPSKLYIKLPANTTDFANARFFGALPHGVTPAQLASTNRAFLSAIGVASPSIDLNRGRDAFFIYTHAVIKALKDAGLLGKIQARTASPQEVLAVMSKFPFVHQIGTVQRPNIFPNVVKFSSEDGAQASEYRKLYVANSNAIDAVLNKYGFYTAPMGPDAVRQATAELYAMSPGSEKFVRWSIQPSSGVSAAQAIQASDPIRDTAAELAAQVADTPAAQAEPEPQPEAKPKTNNAQKKDEGLSTGAWVAIGVAAIALIGGGVYFMRQRSE